MVGRLARFTRPAVTFPGNFLGPPRAKFRESPWGGLRREAVPQTPLGRPPRALHPAWPGRRPTRRSILPGSPFAREGARIQERHHGLPPGRGPCYVPPVTGHRVPGRSAASRRRRCATLRAPTAVASRREDPRSRRAPVSFGGCHRNGLLSPLPLGVLAATEEWLVALRPRAASVWLRRCDARMRRLSLDGLGQKIGGSPGDSPGGCFSANHGATFRSHLGPEGFRPVLSPGGQAPWRAPRPASDPRP